MPHGAMASRSSSSSPDPLGVPGDTTHLLSPIRKPAPQSHVNARGTPSPAKSRAPTKRTGTPAKKGSRKRRTTGMATKTLNSGNAGLDIPVTPAPMTYAVRASSPLKNVVPLDDTSTLHDEGEDAEKESWGARLRSSTHLRSTRHLQPKIQRVPLKDDTVTPARTPKRKRGKQNVARRVPTPAPKNVIEEDGDEESDNAGPTPKRPKGRTRHGTPVPKTFFQNHDIEEDEVANEVETEEIGEGEREAGLAEDVHEDVEAEGAEPEEVVEEGLYNAQPAPPPMSERPPNASDAASYPYSSDSIREAPSMHELEDEADELLEDPFGLPQDLDQADIHQTPAAPRMRAHHRALSFSPSGTPAQPVISPENADNAGHTPGPTTRMYPSPSTSYVETEELVEQPVQESPFPQEHQQTRAVPLRRTNDPTSVHREFDSIMESEGFSMVSLGTLPSAGQHLTSSAINAQRPEQRRAAYLPPHLRPKATYSPRPNSRLGYRHIQPGQDADQTLFSNPPMSATSNRSVPNSLLSRPPLRLQFDQRGAKKLFSSTGKAVITPENSDSPPPELSGSIASTHEAQLRTPWQRTRRVVRLGVALLHALGGHGNYSTLADVEHAIERMEETRYHMDMGFQAYDGGVRRTLRSGLRFGVLMAARYLEELRGRLQVEEEERKAREEEERLVELVRKRREEKEREKERRRQEEEERRRETERLREEELERQREQQRLEEEERAREAERLREEEMERLREQERKRLEQEMEREAERVRKEGLERQREMKRLEEEEREREAERLREEEMEKQRERGRLEAEEMEREAARLREEERRIRREEQKRREKEEKERLRADEEEAMRQEEQRRRLEEEEQAREEMRMQERVRHERERQEREEQERQRIEEEEDDEQARELERQEWERENARRRHDRQERQRLEQEQASREQELLEEQEHAAAEEEMRRRLEEYTRQVNPDEANNFEQELDADVRESEEQEQAAPAEVDYPDLSRMQDELFPPSLAGSPSPAPRDTRRDNREPSVAPSDLDVDQTLRPRKQRDATLSPHSPSPTASRFDSRPVKDIPQSSPTRRVRAEMARREEEWNLEREAVARQIQEANESQVIMLDSERESAGGMEEMQVDEEHDMLRQGEDEQPGGSHDVSDEVEATDPATVAVNDAEQFEEVVDDDLDIWQEEARQHQVQGHSEVYHESDEGLSQDAVPTFMDWRRKSSRPEGFEYMSPPKTKTQVERLREGDVSKLLGSPSSVVEKFYRDNGASPVKDFGHEYYNMPEHDAAEPWGQHQEGDFLEETSLAYAKADEFRNEENVDEANEFANPKDVSPAAEVAVGGQLVATPAWLKPRRLPYLDSPALANQNQPAQQPAQREVEHIHASAKAVLPLNEEEHTTLPDEASKQMRQEAPDARKKRRHRSSGSKEAPHHRRRAQPEAVAKDVRSEKLHVSASQGKRDASAVQQTTPFAVRAKRIPIASLSPQKPLTQPKTSKLKPRGSHRDPKAKETNIEERRDANLARDQASSGTEKPPRSSWLTRLASLAPSWLRGSQDFTDVSKHAAPATETAASSQERQEHSGDKQGSLGDNGVVLSDNTEVAPRQKPSAPGKTSHKPQHPSKRQSETDASHKSLATSGYFTDDHYYFLRSLYRHAKATPENFPYIASPAKDALVGQTMAAANGAYSRQVTKLEIAVVDKFKERLSEQSIRRGGSGTVGWTDLELLSRLFTIIVGAEIRKERKQKHLGSRKHAAPATGDVVSR